LCAWALLTFQDSTDFDRFQVMVAKKQRRDLVRKAHFKERKAAA
jgi:large subunit ribosomal protein L14e